MLIPNKKGFTLVELIVVIIILAILATIAFLSFSSQSGSARDSTRLSDMASLKKGFEMHNVNSGTYPSPDNGKQVTYSGGTLWTQGTVGRQVFQVINKTLSKKVSDPLSGEEYTYSLASNKSEYQVAGNLENPTSYNFKFNPFASYASALGGTGANMHISGNYNGVALKVYTGSVYYIVASPSLILFDPSVASNLRYENSMGSGKLLLNGTDNFAKFNDTHVYSSGALPTDSDLPVLIGKLQLAYSGSNVTSNPIIQQIITLSGAALTDFGKGLVKNSLGGSVSAPSGSAGGGGTSNSCTAPNPSFANIGTLTTGAPTSANQAWIYSATPGNCTYSCANGYSGSGCSMAPASRYPGCDTDDITLSNGQVWSACNVGATKAYTGTDVVTACGAGCASDPYPANRNTLGTYFQWGRNTGVTASTASAGPVASETNAYFHMNGTAPYDWLSVQNDSLWGGNGTSSTAGTFLSQGSPSSMQGPCATNYHVPTQYEWWQAFSNISPSLASTSAWQNDTSVRTTLKLPLSGSRDHSNAYYYGQGTYGNYWASSPYGSYSHSVHLNSTQAYPLNSSYRANGLTVRCIKN